MRAGWAATVPEVCNGPRQASLLADEDSSLRAGCCDDMDPDVCRGLSRASLFAADESSDCADCCDGTDPDVCNGPRKTSFLAFELSMCAPVMPWDAAPFWAGRYELDNEEPLLILPSILAIALRRDPDVAFMGGSAAPLLFVSRYFPDCLGQCLHIPKEGHPASVGAKWLEHGVHYRGGKYREPGVSCPFQFCKSAVKLA